MCDECLRKVRKERIDSYLALGDKVIPKNFTPLDMMTMDMYKQKMVSMFIGIIVVLIVLFVLRSRHIIYF